MYLFLGGKGVVVAISPEGGGEVWRTVLVEKKFFTMARTVDYRVMVLDHESRVFAIARGHLYALDAATGSILWSIGLSERFGRDAVTLAISGKSIKPDSGDSGLGLNLPIE